MEYKVEWAESGVTKGGKSFKKVTLNAGNDQMTENVTIWADFPSFSEIGPGSVVNGKINIKENGKYTNITLYPETTYKTFQAKPKPTAAAPTKAFQERQGEMIKEAQERKSESIAFFNATNNAIEYIKTFYPNLDPDDALTKVFEIREQFLTEWRVHENKSYQEKHSPF